jgi:hypothetical protein
MDSIFLKPRSIFLSPAKLDLMKAISPPPPSLGDEDLSASASEINRTTSTSGNDDELFDEIIQPKKRDPFKLVCVRLVSCLYIWRGIIIHICHKKCLSGGLLQVPQGTLAGPGFVAMPTRR